MNVPTRVRYGIRLSEWQGAETSSQSRVIEGFVPFRVLPRVLRRVQTFFRRRYGVDILSEKMVIPSDRAKGSYCCCRGTCCDVEGRRGGFGRTRGGGTSGCSADNGSCSGPQWSCADCRRGQHHVSNPGARPRQMMDSSCN